MPFLLWSTEDLFSLFPFSFLYRVFVTLHDYTLFFYVLAFILEGLSKPLRRIRWCEVGTAFSYSIFDFMGFEDFFDSIFTASEGALFYELRIGVFRVGPGML